jgi:hypothetical protein
LKKLFIGLTCLSAVVLTQAFGLDQYDKTEYDRRIAYVQQLNYNNRDKLSQIKAQKEEEKASGAVVIETGASIKSLEWVKKPIRGWIFA